MDLLVGRNQGNVVIRVQSIMPRLDWIKTVGCSRKARSNVLIQCICCQVRTSLRHGCLNSPRLVQPLVDIVLFIPCRRSHFPLRGRLVKIRLIAKLPVCELAIFECFASQRDRSDQAVVSDTAVLGQVEAVYVLRSRPRAVRIEVGRTNGDSRRVVRRLRGVYNADESLLLVGIVKIVVPAIWLMMPLEPYHNDRSRAKRRAYCVLPPTRTMGVLPCKASKPFNKL